MKVKFRIFSSQALLTHIGRVEKRPLRWYIQTKGKELNTKKMCVSALYRYFNRQLEVGLLTPGFVKHFQLKKTVKSRG